MAKQGTCWTGYSQKGFKIKNGKSVPNCVSNTKKVVKKKAK